MPRPLRPELRALILESAAQDFADRGFHALRLEELAEHCGVTKGAIYFHFRGKVELFYEALRALEQLRQERVSRPGRDEDPVESLRQYLKSRLDFHHEHPELLRLRWILDTELGQEATAALRPGIRNEYRETRSELRRILQRGAMSGQLDTVDPASDAFHLASLLEGALVQHCAAPDDVEPFWDTEQLSSSWLSPYSPKPRPAPRRPARNEDEDRDFQPTF